MFKVVLFLLVLLGAALYFPQTRLVVVDTLGPVVNPVLIWQTKGEIERIGRELQTLAREGSDLPPPGESFENWMSKNFLGGAKTDAWGMGYSMRVWRDWVTIVSNGPDKEIDTADDIVFQAVAVRLMRRR